jgi:hypothetical protein
MNNISYISNPLDIKVINKNDENDFDKILKSCGIRSRSTSSTSIDDSIPISDSFKKDEKKEIDMNDNELYCSESSNFPNIPFGSTPPDTHRIRELYMQYMSHIQLKNKIDDDNKFDKKNKK